MILIGLFAMILNASAATVPTEHVMPLHAYTFNQTGALISERTLGLIERGCDQLWAVLRESPVVLLGKLLKLGDHYDDIKSAFATFVNLVNYSVYSLNDIDPPFRDGVDSQLSIPRDSFNTFEQICIEQGLMVQRHYVETQDGHINTMFRVFKDSWFKDEAKKTPKPAVVFLHGLLDSSDGFVISQIGKAPAVLAARAGYDVWLGNNRGNKYSLMHRTFDPAYDNEFWDHSFVEFGKYDVPAFIDYAKNQTGLAKVSVIAHSQGTNTMFYGMASNPEYFKKSVNLFVALSPSARLTRAPLLVHNVVKPLFDTFEPILRMLNVNRLMPPAPASAYLCGWFTPLCELLNHFLITSNQKSVDLDSLKSYMGHFPSGSSRKSI